MAAKIRQFPRRLPGSMWWGAVAVAQMIGFLVLLLMIADHWVQEARANSTGSPTWLNSAFALTAITAIVLPLLLWAGFAARVARRWWLTGVLAAATTLLIFPAAVLAIEAPQKRPLLSPLFDAGEPAFRVFSSVAILSFLVGAGVHAACRWLLIRPQPDAITHCWNCGGARAGLPDERECQACAAARTAPMGRCAGLASRRGFLVTLAMLVTLTVTALGGSVAWKYVRSTRPALAMLRQFGGPELAMSVSIPAEDVFVGRAAVRPLGDGQLLVLLIPDERISGTVGIGGSTGGTLPAAQLFVGSTVQNGWVTAAWYGSSSSTGYAMLNEHQLARLDLGVPPGLVEELLRPTGRNTGKRILAGVVRVDAREWLGD